MRIDTTGGLCGHYSMTVYSNAKLYKHGRLQLDSLMVKGGKVVLDGPGESTFTESVIVTGAGASMLSKGGKMSVGP